MKCQVYNKGITINFGQFLIIWDIDIIRMYSWFWVKWFCYFCCTMFGCPFIEMTKFSFNDLTLYLNNHTYYNKVIHTTQYDESTDINCLLFVHSSSVYSSVCTANLLLVYKHWLLTDQVGILLNLSPLVCGASVDTLLVYRQTEVCVGLLCCCHTWTHSHSAAQSVAWDWLMGDMGHHIQNLLGKLQERRIKL